MGDYYFGKSKERWAATGTGTTTGVTVTKAAPSNTQDYYTVSGIQCNSDAAATVTIESPASTVLWTKAFGAAFTMSEGFPIGVIKGAAGQAVLVKVSASTAGCAANIQGFRV